VFKDLTSSLFSFERATKASYRLLISLVSSSILVSLSWCYRAGETGLVKDLGDVGDFLNSSL